MSETTELEAILPDEPETNPDKTMENSSISDAQCNERNVHTDSKKKTDRKMCCVGIVIFWILVGSAIAGIILSFDGLRIDISDDDFPSTLPPAMPPAMPPTSSPLPTVTIYSDSEGIIQAGTIALSSDGNFLSFPAHDNVTQSIVFRPWKSLGKSRIMAIGNYSTAEEKIPVATSGLGNVQAYSYGSKDGSWIGYSREYLGNGSIDGFKNGFMHLSLSLSYFGGILAVGDYKHKLESGVVRTYNITNVTQRTSIGRTFGVDGEAFGNSISLTANGTIMAVGSFHYGFDKRGAVSLFKYESNTSSWVQVGPKLEGSVADEKFGTSVSANFPMTVAIGGPGYGLDNNTGIGQCQVYHYNIISEKWNKIGNSINGDTSGSELGYRVALASQGNLVAISSKQPDMVRVYGLYDNDWTQLGGDFTENATGFGTSIDLQNDILTVGATGDDDGGTIYVYDLHNL